MTDRTATPLGVLATAGQSHKSMSFERLMDTVRVPEIAIVCVKRSCKD